MVDYIRLALPLSKSDGADFLQVRQTLFEQPVLVSSVHSEHLSYDSLQDSCEPLHS